MYHEASCEVVQNVMHYVYVLKLNNGDYYHGVTNDLKRRFEEHRQGKNKSTSRHLPVDLVCYVAFKNKEKAANFEEYLKNGSGFAFRNHHLI